MVSANHASNNWHLAVMTSDNPAAAVKFMGDIFSAKRHDAATVDNDIDDLSKLKVKIDKMEKKRDK